MRPFTSTAARHFPVGCRRKVEILPTKSRLALEHVNGAFFGADGEEAIVGGPDEFRRGGGHFHGGAEGFGTLGAPELHDAVEARGGEEAMGVLEGHGAHRRVVREHGGFAAFGALAGTVPDTRVAAAAGLI